MQQTLTAVQPNTTVYDSTREDSLAKVTRSLKGFFNDKGDLKNADFNK